MDSRLFDLALVALLQLLPSPLEAEYRPQHWELRDVIVLPDDDGRPFQTSFVTCVVQTWVESLPRQPSMEKTSYMVELAAFAVERKRHTFKGGVEIHDADTSSVLRNDTHRLVTRGRRRCLPGPGPRNAFQRFLRESEDRDRIVVVRMLDDQRGRALPKQLRVFAKAFEEDMEEEVLEPVIVKGFPDAEAQQRKQQQLQRHPPGPLLDAPPVLWERKLTIGKENAPKPPQEGKHPDMIAGPDGYDRILGGCEGGVELRQQQGDDVTAAAATTATVTAAEEDNNRGDATATTSPPVLQEKVGNYTEEGRKAEDSTVTVTDLKTAASKEASGRWHHPHEDEDEYDEDEGDISPFPVPRPPPKNNRGENFPIKVPALEQWGRKKPPQKRPPFHYPDILWPVPFTKRGGWGVEQRAYDEAGGNVDEGEGERVEEAAAEQAVV